MINQGAARLYPEDLVHIAIACMDDKWYDSAIKFARAARNLYKASKDEEGHEESTIKQLNKMTKDLVKIQNAMLETKRERVGTGTSQHLGRQTSLSKAIP